MVRSALTLVALSAAPLLVEAQHVRLSGAMVHARAGDVERTFVSPDGLRAVLQVHPVEDPPLETGPADFYGVRTDGSQAPLQLVTGVFLEGPIEITPDHSRVVMQVRAANPNDTLLSLPLDGGPGVPLVTDYLQTFRLAPGSGRVVYALGFVLGGNRLYSVPLDGSQAPVQLSASGHQVKFGAQFVPSPDGQRVVYTTGAGVYSVPVDGSQAPLELTFSATKVIESVDVSPDGQRVIFYQRPSTSGDLSLFSVPLDGSHAPVLLNPSLPGSVQTDRHLFTPDGGRVLYLDEVAGQVRLYSAPIDRSAPAVRLDAVLPANGDVQHYELDPQGVHVVYAANQDAFGVIELYGVPAAGGQPPVKLSGPMVAGGSIFGPGYRWFTLSGDGTRVVYVADEETNDVFELYVAPTDGSAPAVKLSGALVAGGDVGAPNLFEPAFRIDLADSRVAWVADAAADNVFELFGAPLDGSAAPVRLSAALPPGGDVTFALGAAAGGRVLYLADQDENDAFEAYAVPFDGSQAPQRISPPLPDDGPAGDVAAYRLTPDERAVVYLADQDVDESFELYRAPVDGGSLPVKLNPPFSGARSVFDFALPSGGTRVVYTSFGLAGEGMQLCSAPMDGSALEVVLDDEPTLSFALSGGRVLYPTLTNPSRLLVVPDDGSQPPLQLNTTIPGTEIAQYAFSPDGTRVVYVSDQELDGRLELFSVPSDGSQPPTKLSAPLVAGGDVADFRLSADSTRVVFRADALLDGRLELFTVPIAGGAPVRLNAPLVAGGNVGSFAIAPDSIGAVYLADGDADGVDELFGVSFAIPVAFELSNPLVTGGDVTEFEICPDNSRVVFRADAEVDQRFELYGVPLDRSHPPLKLNGPFAPGASVTAGDFTAPAFRIRLDSRRVVYRANPEGAVADLFSVPVDRSRPPTRLTRLGAGVHVPDYRMSEDGRWLVFLANTSASAGFELWRVPVDGSEPPMRLHAPLHRNLGVQDFALTRNGRAVYRADQRLDEVLELFASVIRSPALPLQR